MLRTSLNTPDSCILPQRADTMFISVFIHSSYGICRALFPPEETPIGGVEPGGLKCQQISDWQNSHPSPRLLHNPKNVTTFTWISRQSRIQHN